jgi:hypothetical protein
LNSAADRDDAHDEPVKGLQIVGVGERGSSDAECDAGSDHERDGDAVEELHRAHDTKGAAERDRLAAGASREGVGAGGVA